MQAVLTAYYEDIKGFRAPEVSPRPKLSSSDSRTKRMSVRTKRFRRQNKAQGLGLHHDRGLRLYSSSSNCLGCSSCPLLRQGSSSSPAGGEEPAAVLAVAESAFSPAGKAGVLGGKNKKTKG